MKIWPFLATVAILASTKAQVAAFDPFHSDVPDGGFDPGFIASIDPDSTPSARPYGYGEPLPTIAPEQPDQKKNFGQRNHGIGQGKGKGFDKGAKGKSGNMGKGPNKENKGNKGKGQGRGQGNN